MNPAEQLANIVGRPLKVVSKANGEMNPTADEEQVGVQGRAFAETTRGVHW